MSSVKDETHWRRLVEECFRRETGAEAPISDPAQDLIETGVLDSMGWVSFLRALESASGLSELGALLDPLADKALLVSIYVSLGIWGAVPRWIVILVVSRDIMIVTAVIVSWLFGKPIPMKPLMVSKLNTAAQVAFAALVLAALGFGFNPTPYDLILMGFVTVFTLVSVSLYLVEWVRHMSTIEAA